MCIFSIICLLEPSCDETASEGCDDSQFGLQASVIDRALTAVKRLDFGGVIINDTPTCGGNRQSGLGREGLRFASPSRR